MDDDRLNRFELNNAQEILRMWGPTIIHLVERQARNDFMFTILEKQGYLPEGSNDLGDALVEKLRGESEAEAIKMAAKESRVIPFEYVEKVGSVRKQMEKNDCVIANICKALGIEVEG